MKDYGFFVWMAYGITLSLLILQLTTACYKHRKIKEAISQDEKHDD